MVRDVIVVRPDTTLSDAWSVMQRERIRHLPVVDDGALLGMLSDRDVLIRASLDDRNAMTIDDGMMVRDAMTPAPFVCGVSTPVAEIADIMIEQKIDALPVVSHAGRLLGLVTSTDLLRGLLATAWPWSSRTRAAGTGSSAR